MKYTDKFFKIPIIMYDAISLTNAYKQEEQEEENFNEIRTVTAPDFVIGQIAIPYADFRTNKVSWADTYRKGLSIEDVKRDKFQETQIMSINYGEFCCSWDRKKFEEKLNEFIDKIENAEKDLG